MRGIVAAVARDGNAPAFLLEGPRELQYVPHGMIYRKNGDIAALTADSIRIAQANGASVQRLAAMSQLSADAVQRGPHHGDRASVSDGDHLDVAISNSGGASDTLAALRRKRTHARPVRPGGRRQAADHRGSATMRCWTNEMQRQGSSGPRRCPVCVGACAQPLSGGRAEPGAETAQPLRRPVADAARGALQSPTYHEAPTRATNGAGQCNLAKPITVE